MLRIYAQFSQFSPFARSGLLRLSIGLLSCALMTATIAQESSGTTSSGWGTGASNSNSPAASRNSGEVLPVEFVVKLKGKKVEGQDRITLEGETRVQNSRLEMYFKRKQRETQNSGSSYGGSTVNTGNSTLSGGMGWSGDYAAGLVNAHFKLLQLQPATGTGKVTAELYMGENETTPYLEALEVRLNPFKKTAMELVMSTFYEVDLRSVRVIVSLDGAVKDEWAEQEFTADFRCYLQVGESYSGYGFGTSGSADAEIQWVEDGESNP